MVGSRRAAAMHDGRAAERFRSPRPGGVLRAERLHRRGIASGAHRARARTERGPRHERRFERRGLERSRADGGERRPRRRSGRGPARRALSCALCGGPRARRRLRARERSALLVPRGPVRLRAAPPVQRRASATGGRGGRAPARLDLPRRPARAAAGRLPRRAAVRRRAVPRFGAVLRLRRLLLRPLPMRRRSLAARDRGRPSAGRAPALIGPRSRIDRGRDSEAFEEPPAGINRRTG